MTEAPEISLKAEPLFHIGSISHGFPVTNSIIIAAATLILLSIAGFFFGRKIKEIPGRFQNFLESILEAFLRFMEQILGSREKAEQFFPIITTIFLVILTSNWLGLLPGVGSIGLNEFREGRKVFTPLFRAPAADLNFTLALGIIAVFGVNILAVMALGFRRHFGKFFNFKNPVYTFVGLLEFISEFAKIISFSFRLFGNIFAGEVLLIVIGFLVPYVAPLPFLFLEFFVGFIQALVFATLTTVFMGIATAEGAH